MIAVNNDTWMLILLLAVVFGALVAITTFSGRGSLDSIKSKTVGDGQHGTARWATPGEIKKTFRSVPFQTALWRKEMCIRDRNWRFWPFGVVGFR